VPPPSTSATLAARPTPPSPAAARPEPGAALAEARALLHNGSYAEAARRFEGAVHTGANHTILILVACSTETIQKATEAVPAQELFILPTSYKGKSCYRMCWGLYDSEERAASALRSLPDYFRNGGARPKVSTLSSLLP
jgi:hypothetical protein